MPKQKTAVALVDLTTTYDTAWHQGLRLKLLRTIPDEHLLAFIMETLSNRRFILRTSDGQESRARRLKNGVPQGSILAPCLFNIYISDIPTTLSTKLVYADDLALAFTGPDWADVENAMNRDLSTLHTYHHQNPLQISREKTAYALYHLNTRNVGRQLNISVDGKTIEFEPNLTYLGVKLDRSLTFKPHLTAVREKVLSRCAL